MPDIGRMTMGDGSALLGLAWSALVAGSFLRVRPAAPRARSFGLQSPEVRRPRRAVPTTRAGRRRRLERVISDAVPDIVDLFAVAVAAGLNTRLAVRAVAERAPPGPLRQCLRGLEADVTSTGTRLADAVERLPERLGSEAVRPLVTALVDADRYGAALGPTLDRIADDARRSRQRRAEEAARRIPVKLLFPLVTCILPAFGLLTVAPLIAGGLRALRL